MIGGATLEILPQLVVNTLITGSIYALASSGLALTYGTLRVLNFSHGQLMMSGAYLFLVLTAAPDHLISEHLTGFGLGLWAGAIMTAAACFLLAFVSWRVFVAPFQRYSGYLPLITTICLGTILESIVAIVCGVNVQALNVDSFESYRIIVYRWGISVDQAAVVLDPARQLFELYITPTQIIIIGSALLLLLGLAIVVHRSSFGRIMRAVAEHPDSASALGVPGRYVIYITFCISVLLAAYAGVMIGYETNLQPTMGQSYTIKAFAAMILGGLGNIWGTILGAYILGAIENFSIGLDFGGYSLPSGYKDAFAYLIILAVLLLRPQGLCGQPRRKV